MADKQIEEGVSKEDPGQIQKLLERMAELEKDRDMLLQVADRKQLSVYYQRNKEKIPSKVMLRTMENKVILGWRTVEDQVYQEPGTMRWMEKQIVEVLYEDGTAEQFHLSDYNRKYRQVEAEVRARIVDETTGNVALKVVRMDNGKEYTIGIKFIN
jgi:hypothetical protein